MIYSYHILSGSDVREDIGHRNRYVSMDSELKEMDERWRFVSVRGLEILQRLLVA